MIGGCRLFLENVIKYGIRIDPWEWIRVVFGESPFVLNIPPSIMVLLCKHLTLSCYSYRLMQKLKSYLESNFCNFSLDVNVHICVALIIEKALANHSLTPKHGLMAQVSKNNFCKVV